MPPDQSGPGPLQDTHSQKGASKPINDKIWYRYLTLLAIKILKHVWPYDGGVLMLTDKLCVKYGQYIRLSEAATMRFISQHTSIPVPKVFCAFTHSGTTYIVMERIKGDMIGRGWVRRSEKSKAKLLSQLAKMIAELRQLKPPDGATISSVDGGPLYDCRVAGNALQFGPFDTIQEFHRHLRMGLEFDPRLDPDVKELINQQNKTWPLVSTHGDLSSLNILIHGDDIASIIDWQTAGWYPSHWEYITAHQVNPRNYFWGKEIDKFLGPMPQELEMERIRQKYFGDT
ncbi:hypothetical protein A7D00_0109 [Trichophyton violaceum]|uniref:Aminoglycoside phosphotransferase domain-containing protein n=1 Tax=Trichophyton violaceum TaxID=34388 RepID=A0A178FSG6_TRIVO|nr:hypothetical protein A7D00_0109 [Trichophyton violaceum]